MFKTIKAQGFSIKENLDITLYKIDFPEKWFEEFYNNFFDGRYNKKLIKTTNFRKIIKSISRNIVYVGDLYSFNFDKTFIISKEKIDKDNLVFAIKEWGEIAKTSLKNLDLRKEFKNWLAEIDYDDLGEYEKKTYKLTDENGNVSDSKIYDILPNLLANKVVDNGINIAGRHIEFYYAGDKKVISNPRLIEYRNDNASLSINFSIQTTPYNRKPIIIYSTNITRWVKKCFNKEIMKRRNTKVYAEIDDKTLYPLELTFDKGLIKWEMVSLELLNRIYPSLKVPEAYEFYQNPVKYFENSEINLYMNHRLEMGKVTSIKSGLPMSDKYDIHFNLLEILKENYVYDMDEFEQIRLKLKFNKDIDIDKNILEFREKLFNATGKKQINIDVYYEYDTEIVDIVERKLKENFGIGSDFEKLDDFQVNISLNRLSDILKPLDESLSEIDRHEKRIIEIKERIKKKDGITACLVILPYEDSDGNKYFSEESDPKYAIRAGFASIGYLTQFLTPELSENVNYRVEGALLDLYRQLGYFETCSKVKKNANVDYMIPVTALHIINYKKTPYGNTERALVSLTMSPKEGKIFVECPALWLGRKLYWEACLAFQEIATKEGKSKFSKTRVNSDIKSKVIQLYKTSQEKHLMLIESNGVVRRDWKYIADSELSKQEKTGEYRVNKINFSSYDSESGIDTREYNSELRIVRVRVNEEVPSYITPKKESGQCESKSSLFKYNNVFYGIGERPNDKLYKNTFKAISKINGDNKECKLMDMIEIYPILLKEDDLANEWAYIVNKYRDAAHQYKGVLKLPLPMHLAYKLEEYIYKK